MEGIPFEIEVNNKKDTQDTMSRGQLINLTEEEENNVKIKINELGMQDPIMHPIQKIE